MENITVEKLVAVTPKVTTTINILLLQLNPSAQSLTDEDLTALVAQSTTHLFVAKDTQTDTMVGMVTLVTYRIPFAKKALFEDIVIDEGSRGKGIGKKLIMHAIAFANEQGIAYVDLTSNPARVDANNFYRHLGFKKRETNVYRMTL